jgi:hypothetical protein
MHVNTYARVSLYALLCFAWSCGGTDSTAPPPGKQPMTLLLTAAPNRVTEPTDIVLVATLSVRTNNPAPRIEFYEKIVGVDEAPRKIGEVAEDPFTFRRSIIGPIDNGTREYTAKAFAGTTQSASSDAIKVDVAVPDNVLLRADFFYSHARVTSPGAIGFKVAANKVLARVEVYSGAKKVAEGAPTPGTGTYFIFVPVSAADNGRQEYVVKAYDAAGAVVQSSPIPCVVDILWTVVQNIGAFHTRDRIFIASDATGSIYYAGTTESFDVFLVKYDADGHQLWTRTFGGPDHEYGRWLSVDASGRVYVSGVISYLNQVVYTTQCFLNVYDASGSLVSSKQIKTGSMDNVSSCYAASDASGNVYVSGYTRDANRAWPFVLKYDPDGNVLWNREISATPVPGSPSNIQLEGGIAVDRINGGVYVGGYTSTTFDGAPNRGPVDLVVVKFDADGNKAWASQYGTAGVLTIGRRFSADPNGGVYIAGETQDPNEEYSGINALIASYGPDGTRRWVKTLDGDWFDVGSHVAADSRGVYLIGTTFGRASLASGLEITENSQGLNDLFVAKFSIAGDLLSVRLFGTPAWDGGESILIGLNGDIYAAGGTTFDGPSLASGPFFARYRDAP